jgi:hypothetical protein
MGQTKRCLNTRLTEHENNKANQDKTEYGNIKNHSTTCGCQPQFEKTYPMRRNLLDYNEGVIWEAYQIAESGDKTVSAPSINLSEAEKKLLSKKYIVTKTIVNANVLE